jgi:SAM-dependent methyltransferase
VDAKRLIASSYDDAAHLFARFADAHVYRYLAEPLARSLAAVHGPILDVASGTGALARLLADVVAVDISRRQLELNPVPLRVQSDAEDLAFADDSFAASASAFGVNHFPRPERAVTEMARVAPFVALMTWKRPEDTPYAPKEKVLEIIERHCGRPRSPVGDAVERMTTEVGSEGALASLLSAAGLSPAVSVVEVEVPWPGPEPFVDYRLSMMGTLAREADMPTIRNEAVAAVAELPDVALTWRPKLLLGIGRRDKT